jgi:hypothetical protein
MTLPLLALKTCDVGAPFPQTTVTFVIEFSPETRRYTWGNALGFNGPTAKLTVLNKIDDMSDSMKAVTVRLTQLVCSGIVAKKGEGNLLPNGGREWSITWEDFNKSVTEHTCNSANSPGGARSVPYVLTQFRQSMLDDNGNQMTMFTFAVYTDRLDLWMDKL